LVEIVKNKVFVSLLKMNGIDGFVVRNILRNYHGLKEETPIGRDRQYAEKKKKYRKYSYAMRQIMALFNNDALIDDEREYLCKIMTRIDNEKEGLFPFKTDTKGNCFMVWAKNPEECGIKRSASKSLKQALGRQTVLLHDYIQKYNTNKEEFLQKDVFLLISELFFIFHDWEISETRIANFYKNNRPKSKGKRK